MDGDPTAEARHLTPILSQTLALTSLLIFFGKKMFVCGHIALSEEPQQTALGTALTQVNSLRQTWGDSLRRKDVPVDRD